MQNQADGGPKQPDIKVCLYYVVIHIWVATIKIEKTIKIQ